MLIDAAKGIEDRTRKLFEVCRMRKLPIFTFANKMDRPALTPFEIIDQLEKEFNLECVPFNWPIGDGESFQGVYDRATMQVHLFVRGDRRKKISANIVNFNDTATLIEIIGQTAYDKLADDIEMLDSLIPQPDIQRIQVLTLHPVPISRMLDGSFNIGWRPNSSFLRFRDDKLRCRALLPHLPPVREETDGTSC
jgi:peptide chain release factor 3